MGVKKMINGNLSSEFISLLFASVYGSCKFYTKLRLASGFTLTKSARTVTLQDVQPRNVTSGLPYPRKEVTISVREYPENHQKIATSNVIFSRTADRNAAKFCMTI